MASWSFLRLTGQVLPSRQECLSFWFRRKRVSVLAARIIALHEEGKSYSQIKEILGCSKGTISYHVGMGQKEKTAFRQTSKRSAISKHIQEAKQSQVCADCGEDYPYWMMQFDHLRDKKFNISQYRQKTSDLEVIQQEIDKCEVVCANCHANRSFLRQLVTGGGTMDVEGFYDS